MSNREFCFGDFSPALSMRYYKKTSKSSKKHQTVSFNKGDITRLWDEAIKRYEFKNNKSVFGNILIEAE